MNIGDRIRERREALGISQAELAEKVGYTSRSSITKIEREGHGIPRSKVELIAKVLKTTPSYLMGWEDEEIADLTARQEETISKFFCLTEENQILIDKFIDSLLEQQKG